MPAAAVLALFPALASLIYITAFGVNAMFEDDFAIVPYVGALRSNTLTLQSLFDQHNEHRILFPRMVFLTSAQLTHLNSKAGMYFYWLCLCSICGVLFLVFREVRGMTSGSLLSFAPASWLIFSPRQWENLLWGWQLPWGMAVAFSLLALYLLARRSAPALSLVLALLSGVVASFSLAGGLAVWPAGLLEICCLGLIPVRERNWWIRAAIWSLFGAATATAYLHGYLNPPDNPVTAVSLLRHPVHTLGFFMAALGASLSMDAQDAAGIGVLFSVLLGYAVVQYTQRPSRVPVFWLAAVALDIFFVMILTRGRIAFGLEKAAASRYTVFGLTGVAALYLWLVSVPGRENRIETLAKGAMFALVGSGLIVGYQAGLYQGHQSMIERQHLAVLERNFSTATYSELQTSNPWPPAVCTIALLAYLSSQHLNVFYHSGGATAVPSPPSGACWVSAPRRPGSTSAISSM
jgi:hypothetical protein